MERRRFLRGSAGLVVGAGLAGCSGGSNAPPPRKAEVFADVSLDGPTMRVSLVSDPVVESRADGSSNLERPGADSLAPVGAARAAKGGRGATGRGAGGYSNAPTGRHGWAVWHGGDYEDDWREEHTDELRMRQANVTLLGAAWLGTSDDYSDEAPGPGEEPLDETWRDPDEGTSVEVPLGELSDASGVKEGWYRLEADLESQDGSVDFGLQAADLKVDDDGGVSIEKGWHVRPRV